MRPFYPSLLSATLLLATACGDSGETNFGPSERSETGPTDTDPVDTADPTGPAVAPGSEDPPEGPGLELAPGETRATEREGREAVLTILRAEVEAGSPQPYTASFQRAVDAELYRDVDLEASGPTQRISRGRVVDASGEVLWSDRILTSFQLLEYLKIVLDETSSVQFTLGQVFAFIDNDYPNLLEFPVQVPVGLEGGAEYLLEVADDDGEFYEVARLDLERLRNSAEPPEFEPAVQTIESNGPPEDRIDVTILPDGYTESQKDEFLGDARAVADRFTSTAPFQEHAELFNFRTAWLPSKESGASYDCHGSGDSDCNDGFADTLFRYTFAVDALTDQFNLDFPETSTRVAFPIDVAKIFEVAAGTPFDEVIVLSNSDRRSGFGGMKAAMLTAFDDRENFPELAIHEFGHSFGALGDEYFIETDPCRDLGDQAELPANISRFAERDQLKWNQWVEEGAPLPTPAEQRDEHEIGAYERALNCESLHRPAFMCKMRSSSSGPFCAVCQEQLTRQIYDDIDLLRRGYPQVEARENGGFSFASGVRRGGDRTDLTWRLGGEEIGSEPTLELGPDELPSEWTRLELSVSEATGNVRRNDPRLQETTSWWVRSP